MMSIPCQDKRCVETNRRPDRPLFLMVTVVTAEGGCQALCPTHAVDNHRVLRLAAVSS
jgi:hypothetical protein